MISKHSTGSSVSLAFPPVVANLNFPPFFGVAARDVLEKINGDTATVRPNAAVREINSLRLISPNEKSCSILSNSFMMHLPFLSG
jgi:hypothetical protein